MVLKDGKMLLGKRELADHGATEYWQPGGHLEHLESFEDCARREVREETGIEIKNIRFLLLCNQKDYAPKHYVNVGLIADWASGEPIVKELEKWSSWDWYDLSKLPRPLMKMMPYYLEALKTGKNYFDV